MWEEVSEAKYGDLQTVDLGKSIAGASFTLRNLAEGYMVLCQALEWEVGDGQMTQFCLDQWLGPFRLVDLAI